MNTINENTLLKELFNHANESIIVVDGQGIIKILNPATENLFGYDEIELKGKLMEVLLPDSVAKTHHQHRNNFNQNPIARKMGIGLDLFARKKNGTEFPVEISLSPFENNGVKFIIAFIIDISRRKEVENKVLKQRNKLEILTNELKAANEKLEGKVLDRTKVLQEAISEIEKSRAELSEALEKEKELNELKSRFLSMASHEFRTPLTTILSSASLIPEYPAAEQQNNRLKHIDRIKSAVNNLNDILSDFLSLSKIEEGKVEANFIVFDMHQLFTDIVDEMKGICKKDQEIIYVHKGNRDVKLDPKLLRNVLNNLISNAIKFSDEGKKITIKTTTSKTKIFVEISDEGMGISYEDQQHLFQRFFRGSNATNIQGTGLGLSIVERYVELMHGKIIMESQIEKGTTFTLTFNQIG
jgi:PAS domain S-box-containing protein